MRPSTKTRPRPIAVLSNDVDVDGDALSVTVTTAGLGTAIVVRRRDDRVHAPPDYSVPTASGTPSTTARRHGDGHVSVTVNAVNDTPTAANKRPAPPTRRDDVTLTGADVETCD